MSQARLFDPRFGFGWSGQTKKEREKKPCVRYLLSVTLSDLGMNTNLRNNLSGQEGKKKKKNSKIKHDDYKTRTYLWQLLFCFCCCWYCLLCCSHGVPLMRRLRRGKGGGRKKKQEQENSRRHDSFIGQWLCCLFVIVIIIIFFFFLPPPFQLEQFNLPYQPEIEVVEGIHGLSCTSCWQIIYHSTPSSQHTHTKAPSPNYPTQQTVPSWHVVPAWAIAPVAVAVVVVEVVLQM